jgi:hypothetical protein
MVKKFTLEEHNKRMREALNPPQGNTALEKLKEVARSRRKPR